MLHYIEYDSIASSETLEQLITRFLAERDVSTSTKDVYYRCLGMFFIWARKNELKPRSLQIEDAFNFKTYLEEKKRLASATVSLYLTVARAFFRWLSRKSMYHNIFMEVPGPKRNKAFKREPLTVEMVKKVFSIIDTSTVKGARDYAIISLMARAGLRCCEISRLEVKDLTEKYNKIGLMLLGKWQKEKSFYPIALKAYDDLEAYLTRIEVNQQAPLFISTINANRGITPSYIGKLVKRYLKIAGISSPSITAHSYRHFIGTEAARRNFPIIDIQGFLRHSNTKVSEIYMQDVIKGKRINNEILNQIDNII